MLKKMLGIDPTEIKQQIEEMAAAAKGMHLEQQRIAEFQNMLAQNAINANKRLGAIDAAIHIEVERATADIKNVHQDLATVAHDLKNMMQGITAIYDILHRIDDDAKTEVLGAFSQTIEAMGLSTEEVEAAFGTQRDRLEHLGAVGVADAGEARAVYHAGNMMVEAEPEKGLQIAPHADGVTGDD